MFPGLDQGKSSPIVKSISSGIISPDLSDDSFLSTNSAAMELFEIMVQLPDQVSTHYGDCNFYEGIECIIKVVRQANTFVQNEEPWTMKNHRDKQANVVHVALSVGQMASILLQPIVPAFSSRMLDILAVPEDERTWEHAKLLPYQQRPLGKRVAPFIKLKDVE